MQSMGICRSCGCGVMCDVMTDLWNVYNLVARNVQIVLGAVDQPLFNNSFRIN